MQSGLSVLQLFVADLENTAAFYRDVVGIDLGLDDEGPDAPHYEGWWDATEDRDYLYLAFWGEPDAAKRTRLSVGFLVNDLDVVHARAVAAGISVLIPPGESPYGRRAEYLDPDGNRVSVGQR